MPGLTLTVRRTPTLKRSTVFSGHALYGDKDSSRVKPLLFHALYDCE
jgi:hypothetical protein